MPHGPEFTRLQCMWMAENLIHGRLESADCTSDGLFLSFYVRRSKEDMFFCWHPECYGLCRVTPEERKSWLGAQAEKKRPVFHDALRVRLVGSVLVSAVQLQRDRVYRLDFSRAIGAGVSKRHSLILESTERHSNATITDDTGEIWDILNRVYPDVNRYRTLLPGSAYALPPPVRGSHPGLGRQAVRLYEAMNLDAARMEEDLYADSASCAMWHGYVKDGYVTALPGCGASDAMDVSRDAVFCKLHGQVLERQRQALRKIVLARRKSFATQAEKIESGGESERAEKFRLWGSALLGAEVPKGACEAALPDWERGGEMVCVPIDPAMSAAEQSAVYFKKYRKLAERMAAASAQMSLIKSEIATLDEQETMLGRCGDFDALHSVAEDMGIKKPVAKTKGRIPGVKCANMGGVIIYMGESAKGNRRVTFRQARPDDMWFHAQGVPGAHVVLRVGAGMDAEAFIEIAASLAAYYSSTGSGWVDYTHRRNVRSLPDMGVAGARYEKFKSLSPEPLTWDRAVESLKEVLAASGM